MSIGVSFLKFGRIRRCSLDFSFLSFIIIINTIIIITIIIIASILLTFNGAFNVLYMFFYFGRFYL